VIVGLISINLAFYVLSSVGFKWSATSAHWRGFLWWQVWANVAGFLGVLALTGLLRMSPLHQAHGITRGLGFVLVQVVAARVLLGEAVSLAAWLGSGLIAAGIVLISLGS